MKICNGKKKLSKPGLALPDVASARPQPLLRPNQASSLLVLVQGAMCREPTSAHGWDPMGAFSQRWA